MAKTVGHIATSRVNQTIVGLGGGVSGEEGKITAGMDVAASHLKSAVCKTTSVSQNKCGARLSNCPPTIEPPHLQSEIKVAVSGKVRS